ncbi:MAG: hypothetical protein JWO69_1065 [Thermoleophilia bacterium]|jgi:hypothetical protein|nr:hypothetical protein [Thermoleophilia bacterium]
MTPPDTPDRFHAFSRLVLTVTESSLDGIRTEHAFELRARDDGAEVWRSSVLYAGGQACESGERYVGSLTSRQVIDLLEEIERSGVYEALPALGLVAGSADPSLAPTVSMHLVSAARERRVLDHAPADHAIVHDMTEAVRRRVELAMERALTSAG